MFSLVWYNSKHAHCLSSVRCALPHLSMLYYNCNPSKNLWIKYKKKIRIHIFYFTFLRSGLGITRIRTFKNEMRKIVYFFFLSVSHDESENKQKERNREKNIESNNSFHLLWKCAWIFVLYVVFCTGTSTIPTMTIINSMQIKWKWGKKLHKYTIFIYMLNMMLFRNFSSFCADREWENCWSLIFF